MMEPKTTISLPICRKCFERTTNPGDCDSCVLKAIQPAFEKLVEYAKATSEMENHRGSDAVVLSRALVDKWNDQRREALALAEKVEVKE